MPFVIWVQIICELPKQFLLWLVIEVMKKSKNNSKEGAGIWICQVILLHVQYLFLWNWFLVKLGFIWHTLIMVKECDLVKLIKGILFFFITQA